SEVCEPGVSLLTRVCVDLVHLRPRGRLCDEEESSLLIGYFSHNESVQGDHCSLLLLKHTHTHTPPTHTHTHIHMHTQPRRTHLSLYRERQSVSTGSAGGWGRFEGEHRTSLCTRTFICLCV